MKTILMIALLILGQGGLYAQATIAQEAPTTVTQIPSQFPLAQKDFKTVSSHFGYRKHPIYQTSKLHTGIDLVAHKGAAVLATASGVIQKSEYQKGYGNYILLSHFETVQTLYAHLWIPLVKKGDIIVQGQIIGLVGETGLATGPHLHYEIRIKNKKINPMLIWKGIIREHTNHKV